jgi:hypothetical protein
MLDSVLAFAVLAIVLSQDIMVPQQLANRLKNRKAAQKDSMLAKPAVNRVKVW